MFLSFKYKENNMYFDILDSLLPSNYISACAEMNAKLDILMSKWSLYENPLIREQCLAKARNKWQKIKSKKNVSDFFYNFILCITIHRSCVHVFFWVLPPPRHAVVYLLLYDCMKFYLLAYLLIWSKSEWYVWNSILITSPGVLHSIEVALGIGYI